MSKTEAELKEEMDDLESAEDFLDYFEVEYDPKVVQVFRLHILTRFSQYLSESTLTPEEDAFSHHQGWLNQAYQDFVASTAQEQKALKVFKDSEPGFVSFDDFD